MNKNKITTSNVCAWPQIQETYLPTRTFFQEISGKSTNVWEPRHVIYATHHINCNVTQPSKRSKRLSLETACSPLVPLQLHIRVFFNYIINIHTYIIFKKNPTTHFKSTGFFQFPPLEMKHSCYGSNNRMIANSCTSSAREKPPKRQGNCFDRGAVASPVKLFQRGGLW